MSDRQTRVVFVTGGGRGIGRAIAHAFSAAGAHVAVAARTRGEIDAVAADVTASGGRAVALECDVTSESSVARAIAEAESALGPVDVLVSNAGTAESAPFARVDPRLWQRTFDVNVTGTYLCARAVVPGMTSRRYGRIVHIASTAGRIGYRYSTAYCAAKHAVVGFTRALALELAASGVTVNAICPGFVDTDMTSQSIARIVAQTGRTEADARASLERMSPQRRLMTPEEVAAVAVFLASDGAAGITGQAIPVDGGEVMA